MDFIKNKKKFPVPGRIIRNITENENFEMV